MTRIFHISSVSDWDAALASGSYTTSTRGRSLAEEGFLHASRGDQWQGVQARYYADVTEPHLLLVIDTDKLTSPLVDEEVPNGDTYPHIYGPLNVDAVVNALPLPAPGQTSAAAATTPPAASQPAEPLPQAPVNPAPPVEATTEHSEQQSFSALFLREVIKNALLGFLLMGIVAAFALGGQEFHDDYGALIGIIVGLGLGIFVVRWLNRRFS